MSPYPKIQLLGGAMFRSFRNIWMLEELGCIPYEHIRAMPAGKKITKYHSIGKIPLLIVGDADGTKKPFVLYESTAINTYLGELVPSSQLVPSSSANLQQRAKYNQTISFLISELDSQALGIWSKHEKFGQFFGTIPKAVKAAKQQFDRVNDVLIQQLEQEQDDAGNDSYLLGKQFTAADILYVHCLDWSKSIRWDDEWKQNPLLCQYYALCTSRPAYQRTREMRKQEVQDMMKQQQQEKKKTLDNNSPSSKL